MNHAAHPKVVVVNICGALNSGDHTQLVSLLKVVGDALPRAHVTCVHRNPDIHREILPEVAWTEALGTSHASAVFPRRLGNLRGTVPAVLRLPRLLPEEQRKTFFALRDADVVIACPGGYFGDPGPHLYTALLHMIIAKRAKLFLAPQSIGPIRSSLARRLTAWVLRHAAGITVREDRTHRYVCEAMGVELDPCMIFPDMAFFERDFDSVAAEAALVRFGVPHRRIAATTLWPSDRLGVSQDRYFGILATAARHLRDRHGIHTVVLRQAMEAEGVEGDGGLLRRAESHFASAATLMHEYLAPRTLRGIVRICRVTYGTRMHGNVFSLAQCVPTVAISYNHKTDGIMEMCGQRDLVLPLTKLDHSMLVTLLDRALSRSEEIVATLRDRTACFQGRRAELVELIKSRCLP